MGGAWGLLLSIPSVICLHQYLLIEGYYYFSYNPRLFVAHIIVMLGMGDFCLVHVSF